MFSRHFHSVRYIYARRFKEVFTQLKEICSDIPHHLKLVALAVDLVNMNQ